MSRDGPRDLVCLVHDVVPEHSRPTAVKTRAGSQDPVHIEPVRTWMSQSGFDAERSAPGSSADSVVWADVTQRAYEESELNWTYVSFMTLATVIASIAIVLDSQNPRHRRDGVGTEFVAVAALGLALVRRRFSLFRLAARTLVVGFLVAIALTAVAALGARGLGWVVEQDITGPRPGTAFIYTPPSTSKGSGFPTTSTSPCSCVGDRA